MSENSLGTWFLSLSSFLGQSLKKKTKCSVPFRLQYDPPLSVPSLCLYTKQTLCLSNNNHWLAWHSHPKLGQVILELCAEARHTCTCKQKTKMCQGLYLTKPGSNIYACDKSGSSLKRPDIRPRRISLLYPQSPNYLRGHSTGLQTHLVTEKKMWTQNSTASSWPLLSTHHGSTQGSLMACVTMPAGVCLYFDLSSMSLRRGSNYLPAHFI